MGHYTLYPCRPDGMSQSFVSEELTDDDAAILRARDVLSAHHSASYVTVYCGARLVGAYPQLQPFAIPAVLG